MMKRLFWMTGILAGTVLSKPAIEWKPLLQQTGLYFFSDRITIEGLGAGAGVLVVRGTHLVGQTDINILWGNGNAFSTRIAAGYQRSGHWSPALVASCGLLWGQRTEILAENGERPVTPIWFAGLRATLITTLSLEYGF